MQIEIDFEVFKTLTNLRESEADSYNAVIRRLLGLSVGATSNAVALAINARKSSATVTHGNALAKFAGGAWFGNVHFPEGTQLRATYKGETFRAEIRNGQWIDQEGLVRTSPSEAARAISGTNVNGWRFWHAKLPDDASWRRLDEWKG